MFCSLLSCCCAVLICAVLVRSCCCDGLLRAVLLCDPVHVLSCACAFLLLSCPVLVLS